MRLVRVRASPGSAALLAGKTLRGRAGDASRDVQFVVEAAAEGALAAVRIHQELLREDGMSV